MTSEKNGIGLIKLDRARWKLARIWFGFCGVVFLILIGQSIGDVYGEDVLRAWGWALPNFLPTLSLMVSVFAADALRPRSDDEAQVRKNFLQLSYYSSIFYLAVFLFTILSPPLALSVRGNVDERAIDILELSNLWLAPLQGLVIALVGVLFFLKEVKSKEGEV